LLPPTELITALISLRLERLLVPRRERLRLAGAESRLLALGGHRMAFVLGLVKAFVA
jgi:hypothetical protein